MDELFAVEEIIEKMLKTPIEVHCEHSTRDTYLEWKEQKTSLERPLRELAHRCNRLPQISNGL